MSVVSKIIEKSIHLQIEDYLKKIKLIYMYQSGYRANHASDFCLAKLIDFILTGMDKQMNVDMIFVDLQKAFDTLDHEVLLEKVKYFGLLTSVIKWFEFYLSSRNFLVCIYVFFGSGTLKYGVPQGSFLGPFLFVL